VAVSKTLDQITRRDGALVGGKAFNCALLKQAGLPVPDGIVLTTEAMGLHPEGLGDLQQWLSRLPSDAQLAVRSSATDEDSAEHSFAGIHETRLNVAPDRVPDAIRVCWASVQSPQAMAYRRSRGLSTDHPKTAVLIQKMVRAISSGVAFTVNPVTGLPEEMLVNSVWGLGESLVSGRVQPDEFRVRKSDRAVLSSEIAGPQPSLNGQQLRELADLLLAIEDHYGSAQDVEWCRDGSQFWIVQSRPVTRTAAKRDIEWTRANAREVLPDLPSPMSLFFVTETIERAERKFYGKLLAPASELGPMVKMFYGRVYFNVDQVRHICRLTSTAPASIFRSMGHGEEIAAEDEIVVKPAFRQFLRVLPDFLRFIRAQLTVRRRVREQVDRSRRETERLEAQELANMPDVELCGEYRLWQNRFVEALQVVFVLAAVTIYENVLRDLCKRAGFSYERLIHTHLAAGEKSVSSQQAFDLLRLSRVARDEGLRSAVFAKHFDDFITRYGHRGRYESDISLPRYREDPAPLLFAIEANAQAVELPDPDEIITRQNAEAAKAWSEFENTLTFWQGWTLRIRVRRLLGRIKQYYLWRELVRSELIRIAVPHRARHLELARRFVDRGWITARDDYFFLTRDEVQAVVEDPKSGSALEAIVAQRKAERERWAQIEMPLLMRESQLPRLIRHPAKESTASIGLQFRGLCVSAGYAEGPAVVMRDPSEFKRMKRGAILVAPATDPSWTPLFTLASGLVVEVGGLLSHASTVAREYGLPAVANVKNATKIFKDGDRLQLDATNGAVGIESYVPDSRSK
jgi:rifampicin phosphotransferase